MEHIYEYMDSNPEFAPRLLPTEPRDIARSYVDAIIGGSFDDFATEEKGVTIFYGGGEDDEEEISIDSASTVEPGLYDMISMRSSCAVEGGFDEDVFGIGGDDDEDVFGIGGSNDEDILDVFVDRVGGGDDANNISDIFDHDTTPMLVESQDMNITDMLF